MTVHLLCFSISKVKKVNTVMLISAYEESVVEILKR